MKKFLPPLRIAIPAFLFLALLVLSAYQLNEQIQIFNAEAERDMLNHAASEGTQTAGLLEHLFRTGDKEGAKKIFSWSGTDPNVNFALLIDEKSKIVFSNIYELAGRNLGETDLASIRNMVEKTRTGITSLTLFSRDHLTLQNTFPAKLGTRPGSLRPERIGVIYLEHDLTRRKNEGHRRALWEFQKFTITFALFCLLLWGFFQWAFTGRIKKLVDASEKLAEGEIHEPLKMEGKDEVAFLARSFDRMAEQIVRKTKALKESEAKIRAILNTAINPIITINSRGLIQSYNPAAQILFGYSLEEVLGENVRMLMPDPYHSDHDEYIAAYLKTGQPKIIGKIRMVVGLRKDGSQFPMHLSVGEMAAGDEKSFVGIVTDMTERVRVEEALSQTNAYNQAILDGTTYGIIATNREGVIQKFNRGAQKLLGYSPEEVIGKKTPGNIHDPQEVAERAKELSVELGKTIDPGFEVFVVKARMGIPEEGEWTYIRKDGFRFPVLLSVTAIKNEAGEITGFLGVARDITERKQAEKEIREAKEEAERLAKQAKAATQAKSEFLAGMSHEIRTPMNAILGMAELLDETPLNKEQSQYVDAFKGAGETLLALINDILDLSKVEAGKMDFEEVDFDLNALVKETVEIMTVRAKEKGLDLPWSFSDKIPLNLKGDPTRLRQILINLIGNGIKFTDKGSVSLECRLENESQKTSDSKRVCLLFSVKDTGVGIPREKQETIFEAFSQADSTVTRKFGGTGLGLSLTQRFVEKMGGKICVASDPGKGSTFFFTAQFAIGEKTPPPISQTEKEGEPKPIDQGSLPPLNILMAEDTKDNQMLVKAFLKKTPVQMDIAENGQIAVGKFKSNKYDLLLMDVQMPVMDGYTATKEIRAWEKDQGLKPTPIVALTAHAMKEDIQKSLDAGCDGHLTKPIRKAKLLETIVEFSKKTI